MAQKCSSSLSREDPCGCQCRRISLLILGTPQNSSSGWVVFGKSVLQRCKSFFLPGLVWRRRSEGCFEDNNLRLDGHGGTLGIWTFWLSLILLSIRNIAFDLWVISLRKGHENLLDQVPRTDTVPVLDSWWVPHTAASNHTCPFGGGSTKSRRIHSTSTSSYQSVQSNLSFSHNVNLITKLFNQTTIVDKQLKRKVDVNKSLSGLSYSCSTANQLLFTIPIFSVRVSKVGI